MSSPESPAPRRRLSREDRLRQLLEVAWQLVREEGTEALTLGRLAELQALVADPDWAVEPALAKRIHRLLDYVERVRDLIPDDLPRVGRLDDALLVELAWPAFRDQSLDYGDFCDFRRDEQPRGSAAERRQAWENTRLAELALLQQRRDIRSRPYAGGQPLQALFRVS